jgi:hypothetical protein
MSSVPAYTSEASFRSRRRSAISRHAAQIGLDYLEVRGPTAQQWTLLLHFIPAIVTGKSALPKTDLEAATNIQILTADGTPASNIKVLAVAKLSDRPDTLAVTILFDPGLARGAGAYATYTLSLVDVAEVDTFFASLDFSLQANLPGDLDPQPVLMPSVVTADEPSIDYLARDFASYRQLLLNRLDLLMPDWQERHVADLGQVLVDVLAYAADHLSYYQDAVATEAYLATARQRTSVRRHARLVDYVVHEGCNARVWVHVQVSAGPPIPLPVGSQLATGNGTLATLTPKELLSALGTEGQVFETVHDVTLRAEHNAIAFYSWGAQEFVLPQGATQASLRDEGLFLQPGDVLIFEAADQPMASDPNRRHAVRLLSVSTQHDPLGGALLATPDNQKPIDLVTIEWHPADALPFDLALANAVARGNVVLADHGQTVEEWLPVVDRPGRYRPELRYRDLTHATGIDTKAPAVNVLRQAAGAAMPVIQLVETKQGPVAGLKQHWLPRRDLVNSDRFAREFVVETQNDGSARLRFGDGIRGLPAPVGTALCARYRTGNGSPGNVGPESIRHLITGAVDLTTRVQSVRNPLAAQGGTAAESMDQVRQAAPFAFHVQQRGVTADDYAQLALAYPEVSAAAAELRWTGSWGTAFVAVRRRGNQTLDSAFEQQLRDYLQAFRLSGTDLAIIGARDVPLDIALPVRVAANAFRSTVRQALRQAFSATVGSDGRRGFFHADNFGFGQSVYLSQVLTAAMAVPGVERVDSTPTVDSVPLRFKRWGRTDEGELNTGVIAVGALDIVRLDNDAAAPQNGTIEFHLQGGQ